MRTIKFLFALIVIVNSIYLLYLLWAGYLLSDYLWLLQGLNALSYQIYQDPSNLVAIGRAVLLLAQTGIVVLLWFVFIGGKWLWHVLLPPKSIKLVAKPTNMSSELYTRYKEAIAIRPVSRAGSILLIRSFLEVMIQESFKQEKSSFYNSIRKLEKYNLINKQEAALLHNLRMIGNLTSHQRELSSKEITNEDIDSIFHFTERLMQDWYSRRENRVALMDMKRRYKPAKPRARVKSSPASKTKSEPKLIADEELLPSVEIETQPLSPSLDTEEKKPG